MRKINEALQTSKNAVLESNRVRIDKEHAQIIDLVKTSFGISNFANESKHTQEAVKALILEYWNPRTGLTKKGIRALNEGTVRDLTSESTEEQVRGFVRRELQTACNAYAGGTFSCADLLKAYGDVKDKVKSAKVKNLDSDIVNIVYCECLVRSLKTKLKADHLAVK